MKLLFSELKESDAAILGAYHYYVVMPHFFQGADEKECLSVLKLIPEGELIVLNKSGGRLEGKPKAVYQVFKWDIYHVLQDAIDLLHQYERLVLVFPKYSHHPTGITKEVLQFCLEQQKGFSVIHDIAVDISKFGTTYIVLTKSDLALLIKKVRASNYQLGKDRGIISFNETIFKELLDITVITTDFEALGQSTAK